MGKSRGGKFGHKPRDRPQRIGPHGEGAEEVEEGSSEEEQAPQQQRRGLGGQSSRVGMLPPSDSEEDEESEGEEQPKKGGQSSTVGQLPPNSSDEEEGSDSSSDSGPPMNEYLTAPSQKKKVPAPVERTPEEMAKEMERLQIVKQKREQDRVKRIQAEGWDRFQPISETNRPPGYVPADHPSAKS